VSERKAAELGLDRPVRIAAMSLHSGWDHTGEEPGTVELCAREAYADSGAGPEDVSVIELHDASAPAELMAYESLGLCGKGEGGPFVDSGTTWLGGALPVNTSGGLLRKGHPVGATGIAQIVELTEQLQGRSGDRQVQGAKVGLAQNGGGSIGSDAAAMCVTVLVR
jgi:acetyl-CoA acetyltransferase